MADILNAVVAGHICLDILPDFDRLAGQDLPSLLKPGRLVQVGPAQFCSGGPVSNTGLALSRLGIPVKLIAKTGDDPCGTILRGIIAERNPELVKGLLIDPDVDTSYTIIISDRKTDRLFLHCTGANDTFGSQDIDFGVVGQADLFHFGYPPALQRMYMDGGRELVRIMQSAKEAGATTSLDMSLPDPNAESGSADWGSIYKAVLPYVDIFLPSIEELLFTLRRDLYNQFSPKGRIQDPVTPGLLETLSDLLIGMGVKIVMIKMGDRGVYLRTASEKPLQAMGRARPEAAGTWAERERWAPCFKVEVAGTTGSGDSTIAGFLAGLLRRTSVDEALTMAVAVGACNVEAADSLSGLRTWEGTRERVRAGWERLPFSMETGGWSWRESSGAWIGPREKS